MRNKIIVILLCITLTASMLFTACGNTDNSNEIITEEDQESKQEKPTEEPEPEPEKTEEPTPEPDKPLDIETNVKLKYIMEILADIEDGGDYNLSFINDLYALEDYTITALLYDIHSEYGEPEGGRTEADGALFSVKQVENIISSLVGHEVDLSSLANEDGWIETDLRTDVLYTDCKNWHTEYMGDNTWKVYADVYSFNIISEDLYKIAEIVFTVTENANSILDGYSIIEVEATPPKMSEWAKAYYDYLIENYNNIDSKGFEYYPIYLDNDDIPEIYVNTFGFGERKLLYYSDAQIKEHFLASDYAWYQYIPQSGLLMEEMEYINISHTIVQFVNGEFNTISESGTKLKEEYQDEFYPENWMYDYEINGDPVSEEEYSRRLNEIFDTSKAIGLGDDKNNVFELCPLLNMLSSH